MEVELSRDPIVETPISPVYYARVWAAPSADEHLARNADIYRVVGARDIQEVLGWASAVTPTGGTAELFIEIDGGHRARIAGTYAGQVTSQVIEFEGPAEP